MSVSLVKACIQIWHVCIERRALTELQLDGGIKGFVLSV